MSQTKELYQELEEVKKEDKQRFEELMEIEGFSEKQSNIDSIMSKLTEAQRKFLYANYGDDDDTLLKQAKRTLNYMRKTEESLMSPQQKRNYRKARRRGLI